MPNEKTQEDLEIEELERAIAAEELRIAALERQAKQIISEVSDDILKGISSKNDNGNTSSLKKLVRKIFA